MILQFFDDYYKGVIDYWEAKELRTQHVYKIRETEGIPVKKGVKDIFEYIRTPSISNIMPDTIFLLLAIKCRIFTLYII